MLTPEYLQRIIESTEDVVAGMNDYLTEKIAQRIVDTFQATGEVSIIQSSLLDIRKQENTGKLMEEIQAEVEKRLPWVKDEVKKAFLDAGAKIANDMNDATFSAVKYQQNLGNLMSVVLPELERMERVSRESDLQMTKAEVARLKSAYEATNGDIENFTRTAPRMAQEKYIKACDEAYFKVMHGVSPNTAIIEAVRDVSAKGVEVVGYAGRTERIEVAVARAVRTGVNRANGDITLTRAAESGCGFVLVSQHVGARVTPEDDFTNHSWWQGQVYSLDWSNPVLSKYDVKEVPSGKMSFLGKMKKFFQDQKNKKLEDFVKKCGYGQMLGICGINCRHSFGLFYPGVTINNNKPIDSEENLNRYQEEQKQRSMERAIRKTKRKLNAVESTKPMGDDSLKAELGKESDRLRNLLQKQSKNYMDYCKEKNLKPINWRLQTAKAKGISNEVEYKAQSMGGNGKIYYNPEKTYRINTDTFSNEVNNGLSNAAKDLAKLGSENMYEYCKLVNLKTGEIELTRTDHEFGQVGGFFKHLMNNPDKEYAFLHNHNRATSISLPDMQILSSEDNVKVIAAIRNDGIISLVESNGVKSTDYLFSRYEKEIAEYTKANQSLYGSDIMEKAEEYAVKLASKEFGKGVKIYDD